ncbi:MAG: acetolactate synthase small subunit [Candidatus Brockarchaeota archaeon]|nr:acetolactate synthase small subunit [Candidatus Brockarchaeota archaeon]
MIVEDKPGVMQKISGMFTRRGFNIDTIAVGKSESPGLSRITLSMVADEDTLEQLIKQLYKTINVVRVFKMPEKGSVVRELCLVKVHLRDEKSRSEAMKYSDVFKGKIVDISPSSATIQLVGTPEKIDAFLEILRPFGMKEVARTGIIAISRDPKK